MMKSRILNHKPKGLFKICVALASLVVVILLMIVDSEGYGQPEVVKIDKERVKIFEQEGARYLFLPAFVAEDNIQLSDNQRDNLIVMKSENIPAVFITTKSGTLSKIYEDSNYRESGRIAIYTPDGEVNYAGPLHKFGGRGNYSWANWDKKTFSIDIGDSKKILGLNNGGKYALVANASDSTFIRNDIARQMEMAIGMDYTFEGEFIDLYVNCEYMGNYYLCPTLSVGENRIAIENLEEKMNRIYSKSDYSRYDIYETPVIKGWNLEHEPEDITGGYLFEREFIGRYETEYGINPSGFKTSRGECFVVKSPKYCSKDEINYIANYVQDVEDAIYDEQDIGEYIDINSVAKWYVVNEVTKNYDAGVSSAFFYKDSDTADGKLKMASGWDYDMSMGNYLDWMEYAGIEPEGLTKLYGAESSSEWYSRLYDNKEFNQTIRDNYHVLENYLDWMIDEEIDGYYRMLYKSAQMDSVRWKTMYDEKGYHPAEKADYDYLKDYLRRRANYLSAEWR